MQVQNEYIMAQGDLKNGRFPQLLCRVLRINAYFYLHFWQSMVAVGGIHPATPQCSNATATDILSENKSPEYVLNIRKCGVIRTVAVSLSGQMFICLITMWKRIRARIFVRTVRLSMGLYKVSNFIP